MAGKKQYGGGIYSKILKRTLAGRPIEVFYGRVYLKAEGKSRYFRLGTTLKAAQRRMNQILGDPEAALQERDTKPVRRIRFDDLVAAFLKGYRSRGESGYYGHVSQSWIEFFGKADAGSINRVRVEAYRDHLRREEYGDSTIRKYVGALGTCYRWAIGQGLVTANPAEGVKRPSEPNREVSVLSHEEESDLLAQADPQTRAVIDLCLASGMRRGEALDLRWSQVDRAGGAILIHKSKTGKARSIPINARLTAILGHATRHIRADFVLCDRKGQPFDRYTLTRDIESAMQRAGVQKTPGAVFNTLRHTFGSRMAEAGVDMTTLATIMGNSPAICYRHYIRFSPGHLKAAMARLDAAATVAQDGARAYPGAVLEESELSEAVVN